MTQQTILLFSFAALLLINWAAWQAPERGIRFCVGSLLLLTLAATIVLMVSGKVSSLSAALLVFFILFGDTANEEIFTATMLAVWPVSFLIAYVLRNVSRKRA